MAKKYQALRDKMSPERRARVDARVKEALDEMPLEKLRRARDFTQATLADAMQTSQGEVSRLEQRADCYVSTIRNYVEAMGGELDIIAKFPDGAQIKVTQFAALASQEPGRRKLA